MATWRVNLKGLKPVFIGNDIFPDLETHDVTVEFEDKFVISLDKKARGSCL